MTRIRNRRGFTLIELMIVVTIIGVLAVLAVTTYQRYIKRSRTSEATANLGSIKAKEEAYFQEFAEYCNVAEPHPGTLDGPNKVVWNPAAASNWRILGWTPSGNVVFQYDVTAGPAGDPAMPAGYGFDATRPWFLATARGDQDDDTVMSLFEITSERSAIHSEDELE